jgi:hypothetical protein
VSIAVPARVQSHMRVRVRSVAEVGPLWLAASGLLLLCAVYFHSKLDPGTRFAIKNFGPSPDYGPSWFQDQKFGPFTPADLATFAFAYLAFVYRVGRRDFRVSRLAVYVTVAIAIAVAGGVVVGETNGTHSPFGDWRDLAQGGLVAFGLWSTVLRSERGCVRLAQLFVAIVAGYGGLQLVEFLQGGGEIAFYGRTPTADHATLEYMVAAVAVSLAMLRTRYTPLLWWAGVAIGTMVVVLAFRRYAWVELATVFGVFALLSGRDRKKYLKGVLAVVVAGTVAVAVTWSTLQWSERFASLNPLTTKSQNALAATNQSHIDDILDGVDQIQAHPVVGLGVGITYVGQRTARWKGDAGMVHNGPVEIWIKFGILGFLLYFVLYGILFVRIWKRRKGTSVTDLLAWGAGAFLLGNWLVNSTVYSWPFGVWEKSVLLFVMVALAFPSVAVRRAVPQEAS